MTIKDIFSTIWDKCKQRDKIVHFIVGFCLSLIIGLLDDYILGIIVGVVAGAGKELWDSKGHGTVDAWDFAFTAFGAIVAAPFAHLLHSFIYIS